MRLCLAVPALFTCLCLSANRSIAQSATSIKIPRIEAHSLTELADGHLIVSGHAYDFEFDERTGQPLGPPRDRSPLYVIDRNHGIVKEFELTRPGVGSLMPFRDGLVGWSPDAQGPQVYYLDLGDRLRESLLFTATPGSYLYLTTSPRADALYVAESLNRGGMQLTRFDGKGELSWTRHVGGYGPNGLTALDRGVVFVQPDNAPSSAAGSLLTFLDESGETRWSTPTSTGAGGVPHVIRHGDRMISVASRGPDGITQLMSYDTQSGRLIASSVIPEPARLTGTRDGVLLTQTYLYRPYLAMLSHSGAIQWSRWYTPSSEIGAPSAALVSKAGEVVLLTKGADRHDALGEVHLVFLDRKAEELRSLNTCTRSDPLPLRQVEEALRTRYGIDVSLDYNVMHAMGISTQCPRPTEAEYADALRTLQKIAMERAVPRDPMAERVHVRLMGSGPPMQLAMYQMGMPASHSAERTLVFQVNVAAAADFASYLHQVVFPHMARIQNARTRFHEATGQYLAAIAPPEGYEDPGAFFDSIEKSMQALEQQLQAADQQSLPSRRDRNGFILRPGEFGTSLESMRPLDQAADTLTQGIQDARRRREERERVR